MAINNNLFVIGDGKTESYPYRSPEPVLGQVEAELSGYPISAADFNTYLRSTSLVTYSLIDIIKNDGFKDTYNETFDLKYDTLLHDYEEGGEKKKGAVSIIKSSLDNYIINANTVKRANNLIPEGGTGNQLYYLSGDKASTKFIEPDSTVKTDDKKVVVQKNTDAPILTNEKTLSTNDSKFFRIDDSESAEVNGLYKLNFTLDTANKVLTINWIKQE